MKLLRQLLDSQARHFEKGGRFERLYPLWEANDTFLNRKRSLMTETKMNLLSGVVFLSPGVKRYRGNAEPNNRCRLHVR